MVDLGALLQQLKGWTPLATFLGIVLAGGYFGIWVWGKQLVEEKAGRASDKADFERRLLEARESNQQLLSLLLQATGLAEKATFVAKLKVPHDVP